MVAGFTVDAVAVGRAARERRASGGRAAVSVPRRRPARPALAWALSALDGVRDGDGGVLLRFKEHGRRSWTQAQRRRSSIWRASRRARFPLLYRRGDPTAGGGGAAEDRPARAPPLWLPGQRRRSRQRGRPLRPSKAMAELLAGSPTAPAAYQLLAAKLGTSGATGATPEGGDGVHHPDGVGTGDEGARRCRGAAVGGHADADVQPGPELDDLFGGPVTTTRPGLPPSGRRAAPARRAGGGGRSPRPTICRPPRGRWGCSTTA